MRMLIITYISTPTQICHLSLVPTLRDTIIPPYDKVSDPWVKVFSSFLIPLKPCPSLKHNTS
jgi:hypothetical protein